MTAALPPSRYNAWLHCWAVLMLCATLILLSLGTLVTTLHVGMTDPIWPTEPWYLLMIDWREPSAGFLIEHSHRLAGYVVGCFAIVLALGCWLAQPRKSVAWLGTAVLIAVIVQGLLGGFRVLLDRWLGSSLALIHGFFAQIVLCLMAVCALITSRNWHRQPPHPENAPSKSIRDWSTILVVLIVCQVFLGGLVRHTYSQLGQRLHLLIAFVVLGVGVWVFRLGRDYCQVDRPLARAARVMMILLSLQVALGVEVWLQRFLGGHGPASSAVLRSLHFLTGGGLLASAACLRALAGSKVTCPTTQVEERKLLEGVA